MTAALVATLPSSVPWTQLSAASSGDEPAGSATAWAWAGAVARRGAASAARARLCYIVSL
jgi:hypothetical protein